VKITHHGGSSGTAKRVLETVKPALAIASTADEGGHRLEQDTLDWLLGPQKKRRVFETLVDGDITVRTDGEPIEEASSTRSGSPVRASSPTSCTPRS
jgi:beta-lactamase superfamily II metal-dependent hydrolase